MLNWDSLAQFLGENRIGSAIDSTARVEFQQRFKAYYAEINKIKASNSTESSVEHAIQALMDPPIKKLGGRLNLNKDNNYDVIATNSEEAMVTLLECKKVKSNEMAELDNLNKKALQQLIFYYLKEVVQDKKTKAKFQRKMDIKNLMISNGFTWLVWKESDFYDLVRKPFNDDGTETNLAKKQSHIK